MQTLNQGLRIIEVCKSTTVVIHSTALHSRVSSALENYEIHVI